MSEPNKRFSSIINAFFTTPNRANSTQPPPASPAQSSSSSSSPPTSPQRTRFSAFQEWQRRCITDVTYKAFRLPSRHSTPTTPLSSGYASGDFMLGAGMVIIQPASGKIVVCFDTQKKYYFLPKGRKDVNESLEDTAVREASEESGYPVRHFPLYKHTCQPVPPEDRNKEFLPNIEPAYVSIAPWMPRFTREGRMRDGGGEYLTFWYVGQIDADAQWTRGTGMADEQNYEAGLYTFERAVQLLGHSEHEVVVRHVFEVYARHRRYVEEQRVLLDQGEGLDEEAPATRSNSV